MNIKLNGREENISGGTILDLIIDKKLNPKSVVVEYNYNIIKMDKWENTTLKENDNLEILSFVEGG